MAINHHQNIFVLFLSSVQTIWRFDQAREFQKSNDNSQGTPGISGMCALMLIVFGVLSKDKEKLEL